MKIHVATWKPFNELLPIIEKYGLGVELQHFCSPDILDDPEPALKTIEENLIGVTMRSMHAPFYDLVPASRDRLVRGTAKQRFNQGYNAARTLHVKNLIFHSGYFFSFKPHKEYYENAKNFWQGFFSDKEDSIEIHFENCMESDWIYMDELIKTIDKPFVTACLDIGHVNANSHKGFEDWIKGLKDKIRYVHLHNNDGINDDHYGFHKGTIDMVKVLDLLMNYSPHAIWTIENGDILESMEWLDRYGYLKYLNK